MILFFSRTRSIYFGIILIFGGMFGNITFAANIQKSHGCISSSIFDIQNTPLDTRMFLIRNTCQIHPPKTIPSILQEHTGVSNDGKIRVQPKNSMENVRKRFHRMKRLEPREKNEKEKRNFR